MEASALLRLFHEQVRKEPADQAVGYEIEREPGIVRLIRTTGGWAGVTCSELDGLDVDAAIARQLERFRDEPHWEWKLYSYDQPADLGERLLKAGFVAEPVEAVLVAEIADLDLDVPVPAGIELVEVHDEAGARALVAMQDAVFGSSSQGMAEALIEALAEQPPAAAAVMALAGGEPVSGGRIEFNRQSQFAGLWGGATKPQWRRRGIFRALVAQRARLALERGYRYLHVDASEDSRPILERMGFRELAETTPYTYKPPR